MGVLSREVVEFGQSGLEALKKGVSDLNTEIADTKKANEDLKRSMKDGTYARTATEYDRAKKALVGFKKEQEAIFKNFRRDAEWQRRQGVVANITSRYGRVPGTIAGAAMNYGQSALRIGGAVGRGASAIAQSGVGIAGALGASVTVGALANRGFQGTAAAAKLDHEFERLSRSVATDLLPAMNALGSILSRITGARENVRAGKGKFGDYATTGLTYGALGAGIAGGALTGLSFARNQIGAAFPGMSAAIGARLGMGGGAGGGWAASARAAAATNAAGGGIAADIAGGAAAGAAARGGFLRGAGRLAGRFAGPVGLAYLAYETQDTLRHYNAYEDRTDRAPGKEAREKQRKEKDDRTWFQRNFPNVSYAFGLSGGGPPGEKAAAEREKLQAEGGMRIVQGAGERRSSGDLYEELAAGFAQKAFSPGGQNTGNSPIDILGDLLDVVTQIKDKIPW